MSCKGCLERKVGCHSICENYKEFKISKELESNFMNSKRGMFIEGNPKRFKKNRLGQR